MCFLKFKYYIYIYINYRKRKSSDSQSLSPTQISTRRSSNAPVTRSVNILNNTSSRFKKSLRGAKETTLVPRLTRLTFQEENSVGKYTKCILSVSLVYLQYRHY